jgi:hypothetical protein
MEPGDSLYSSQDYFNQYAEGEISVNDYKKWSARNKRILYGWKYISRPFKLITR